MSKLKPLTRIEQYDNLVADYGEMYDKLSYDIIFKQLSDDKLVDRILTFDSFDDHYRFVTDTKQGCPSCGKIKPLSHYRNFFESKAMFGSANVGIYNSCNVCSTATIKKLRDRRILEIVFNMGIT